MLHYTRCGWVFVCTLALYTSQTSPQTRKTTPLSRTVALGGASTTSGAAVSFLLSEARVPGGIISVYDKCAQSSPQEFSLKETTLKEALDYVSQIDGSRKWLFANGLVVVGSQLTGKTILNTVIGDVDIDSNEALSLTTQQLLNTPEVRKSVEKAGLEELTPELGFAQIRKDPVNASPQPAKHPTHLHNITLLNALNTVATAKETGVWQYEQYSCRKKSSFRLDWVVK